MIDALTAALAGGLLGALFYGGLWWTVQRLATFSHPALALAGSGLLRLGITLAGFYWVGDGRWWRIVSCLAGFGLARLAVSRYTRRPAARQARHAA